MEPLQETDTQAVRAHVREVFAAMRKLLRILRQKPRPPTVPGGLERLVRRYIGCRRGQLLKMNQLLQHVERRWEKVSDDAEDATNNVTERIVGQTLKVRSKTMRGFKSHKKVLNHSYLSNFLSGEKEAADLRKVI